jgi:hypothetical protein
VGPSRLLGQTGGLLATATAVAIHPNYNIRAASPGLPEVVVYPEGNRSGVADVAVIEDIPAIRKAMHRGAASAVKARRFPYIRVGVRSLRRRLEDHHDYSRFLEDVTLASSLIDDAVASAIDELYRWPDEFLAKSPSDQLQDARERATRHAWRLLDARNRRAEVRLEPPVDDDSASGDDCPLTSMADDRTLKVSEYDQILGVTKYHSTSHPSWQSANESENRLIGMIDRRRAGLPPIEEPHQTAYERACEVLGRAAADFMAEYEVLRDAGRTKPACCPDRKRYGRFRRRLGHGISPDVTDNSPGVTQIS